MRRFSTAAMTLALAGAALSASTRATGTASAVTPAPSRFTSANTAAANATVEAYCVPCHTDRRRSGGLSLSSFDVANATRVAEIAERVIRRVRAGMMPPAGAKQPERAALTALAAAIEQSIDIASAAAPPDPGHRTFQRLNRAE